MTFVTCILSIIVYNDIILEMRKTKMKTTKKSCKFSVRWQCSDCGKTFKTKVEFDNHMRKHGK